MEISKNNLIEKFGFDPIEPLTEVVSTGRNFPFFVKRNNIEYMFDNYCSKHYLRKNTNILIYGNPGVGKTTFIENYFITNNNKFNYLRINMLDHFDNKIFKIDDFYYHLFYYLNSYLKKQSRNEYIPENINLLKISPHRLAGELISKRLHDENISPLFLFLDNLDSRPTPHYLEGLSLCDPMFTSNNIVIILATRQSFHEFFFPRSSNKIFTYFDARIGIESISLKDVLWKRYEKYMPNQNCFPFSESALLFIEAFSNRNTKSALISCEIILHAVCKRNTSTPIDEYESIEILYENGLMPKFYIIEEGDEGFPLWLEVLKYIHRNNKIKLHEFNNIFNKLGFDEFRAEDILNQIINLELFEIVDTIIDEEKRGTIILQITSKGLLVIDMISNGLMFKLHAKYDNKFQKNENIFSLPNTGDFWCINNHK